ncbi:MAG: pentapeptide repeat-containing protein, partial [Gammaproteobacteria bacterium]|nr:pentapeptide repeat-containing protein [Gammaproteobacteria bacterium]
MNHSELWYCRTRDDSFGPLSLAQTLHYIILKRIKDDDEVSNDGENWQPLKQAKMLNPQTVLGLKGVLSDEEVEYLESTLAWSNKNLVEADESDSADHFSEVRRRGASKSNPLIGYSIVAILIVLVLGVALMIPKSEIEIVPDCKSAPLPAINWSNCRFERANFSNSDLQGAKLRNSFMGGANLQASNLSKADIAYANLSLSNLKGTRFDEADLRGANLRKADMRRASLVGADLSFADLTGANLSGADLDGVKL